MKLLFTILLLFLIIIHLQEFTHAQQQQQQQQECTCCCPRIFPRPQLHSLQDVLEGSENPDNFTASVFTGQRQIVLPSEGLVTLTAELLFEDSQDFRKVSFINNCSWATPTTTTTTSAKTLSLQRCSLSACAAQVVQEAEITWSLVSTEGYVPDLLTTGGPQGLSPRVYDKLQTSYSSFIKRMNQATPIVLGAFYFAKQLSVEDLATTNSNNNNLNNIKNSHSQAAASDPYYFTTAKEAQRAAQRKVLCEQAVSGLPCYLSNYWFLPSSGIAWISDMAIPVGESVVQVIERLLPVCEDILNLVIQNAQNNATTLNSAQLESMEWMLDKLDSISSSSSTVEKLTQNYSRSLALSRSGRLLCRPATFAVPSSSASAFTTQLQQQSSATRAGKKIVPVVPIVRSKSDVIFYHDAALTSCIRNRYYYSPQPGVCRVSFVEDVSCGDFQIEIGKDFSLFLNGVGYLGLGVALISSLSLLFGASALMIAVDAQLLAVISQGSCSSTIAKPATRYLQQFLFMGRAVDEENYNAQYFSSIVAWMVGIVAVVFFTHGIIVVAVSVVRRSLLKKRKGAKSHSSIDKFVGMLYQLAASSEKEKQRKAEKQQKQYFMEERRVLARTAAALRFPSASFLVLLVSLQGLWFGAINVWWYSITPVESIPGIVGCLFALLLTLIVLVLARQTRLIFTPYSWLHPEQAEIDAREQALEVSLALHLRSLVTIKRSWFFPFGAWGPARPRQRMGTLFLPVRSRGWIGVPFLVSLLTCITVSIYPLTILGCCAQQMFLSLFFFSVALVVWKTQPMRAPYANTMFVAVRGALAILCFCRTIFLVTDDEYFNAAYFILVMLVEVLIVVVGVVDIWCGVAEHFIWLPHLEYRQEIIRARTGGALRLQRQHEESEMLALNATLHNKNNNNNAAQDDETDIINKKQKRKLSTATQQPIIDSDKNRPHHFNDDSDSEDTDDDLVFYPGQASVKMQLRQKKKNNSNNVNAAVLGPASVDVDDFFSPKQQQRRASLLKNANVLQVVAKEEDEDAELLKYDPDQI